MSDRRPDRIGSGFRYRTLGLWFAAAVLAFAVGYGIGGRTPDFVVYHGAATSLLEGRTDLYSDSFASSPPQIYVYPPFFLFLVFPLGWLDLEVAFGLWTMVMVLTAAVAVRQAWRRWKPLKPAVHGWIVAALAGPFLVMGLTSGNAHVFVVVLTLAAVLAWSRGGLWASSLAFALGAVIKVLPLFFLALFVVRRDWGLAARVVALTCLFSLLPALYFGPRQAVSLYREWYELVVRDNRQFQNARRIDQSISGTMERWFSRVDYAVRRDPNYPQVTLVELTEGQIRLAVWGVRVAVILVSLWSWMALAAAERRRDAFRGEAVVLGSGILVSAQLLLGPYTPILYLSGWLLPAVASLPGRGGAMARTWDYLLVGLATLNVGLFAIPGGSSQRFLQAAGAFTLIGFALWALMVLRSRELTRPGGTSPSEAAVPS